MKPEKQASRPPHHAIITTGPSSEPIDAVRRLTNFATGQTGTALAEAFVASGWEVTLFRSKTATAPPPVESCHLQVEPFDTLASLTGKITQLARDPTRPVQAILHAAALSDFVVKRVVTDHGPQTVGEGKISSRTDSVLIELSPAPKLIHSLRDLFPSAWIVGWKYEVTGSAAAALGAARAQLQTSGTDACVLNGAAVGSGYLFVQADGGSPLPIADLSGLVKVLTLQGRDQNPTPAPSA